MTLDAGDIVQVLPDPAAVDETGTWQRVVAPAHRASPDTRTECDDVPFVVGWIATGDGDPWVSADLHCPELPAEMSELAATAEQPLLRLACFGTRTMTVHGSLVPPPDGEIGFICPGIDPSWLTCGIDQIANGGVITPIRLPPGNPLPVGEELDVRVQVDHPAAESCVSRADVRYAPEAVTAFCRAQLVVVP